MKIYTSFWSKGNENRKHIDSLNRLDFFLQKFALILKKQNADAELVFITDQQAIDSLETETLELFSVLNILDAYNDYEPHQWPLIKMKAIASIDEPSMLHLDYDIFWDYPIQNLIDYLNEHHIDALFQIYESLTLSHNYYNDFIKENPAIYKQLIAPMNPRMAFNCGIVYLNNDAFTAYKNIVNSVKLEDNGFKTWVSFEQLYVPAVLEKFLTVNVLSNIVSNVPKAEHFCAKDYIPVHDWGYFNTLGVFMSRIRFFHFMGNLKQRDYLETLANEILK